MLKRTARTTKGRRRRGKRRGEKIVLNMKVS